MTDESQRPIIVKRVKKSSHSHYGGSWKIAYADFVTAMMAFFLLMWLLSSVSQASLEGIAEYFKVPLKVALQHGTKSAGQSAAVVNTEAKGQTRYRGQINKSQTDLQTENRHLSRLQQQIQHTVNTNVILKQYADQLQLDVCPEGLKIAIIDQQNRPMFDLGSSTMLPYTRVLLQALVPHLNHISNKLSLSGHTDAKPYGDGHNSYSNWELSADRANAARRELLASGLHKDKVVRVVGMAAALPLDKSNVFAPENRRIIIVVLNKEAEARILHEDGLTSEELFSKEGVSALPIVPESTTARVTDTVNR